MIYSCMAKLDSQIYAQNTPYPYNFQKHWAIETQCKATFTFWCQEVVDYFHTIPKDNETFRQWVQSHLWFANYTSVFDNLEVPKEANSDLQNWQTLEKLINLAAAFNGSFVSEDAVKELIRRNEKWIINSGGATNVR